jgi:hypothetical protein
VSASGSRGACNVKKTKTLKRRDEEMDQGLQFLEDRMREKYKHIKVGRVLKTATMVATITEVEYNSDLNTLVVITDNGQKASAKQIQVALVSGKIELV